MSFRIGFAEPDWPRRLQDRRLTFESLVSLAEDRLARAGLAQSALAIQAAAEYAWRCPFGALAEPRLEGLVEDVAGMLNPFSNNRPRGNSVLHVVTTPSSIGGHTRILCRWMERDLQRTHNVVCTGQHGAVPPRVARAATSSGGAVYDIGTLQVLDRVAALHALAAENRWCVIYHDPSDVVPALALAQNHHPRPTIVVDHADHVFWLGTHMADAVAHIRQAALSMATEHRGLDPHRGVVVPIPLDPEPPRTDRKTARVRLGIGDNEVLLISVAAEYKFGGDRGKHFLDGLAEVIAGDQRLKLIAVGPEPTGRWKQAERATRGRIRAVGPRPDTGPFLDAADLYVDPLFTSFTSILEAMRFGLPVLARRATHPELAYLTLDDPDVASRITWVDDEEELGQLVEAWSNDVGDKAANRAAVAELIEHKYSGASWLEAMNRAYEVAEDATPGDGGPRRRVITPINDRLAHYLAAAHHRAGVDAAFASALLLSAEGRGAVAKSRSVAPILWACRRDRMMWGSWLRQRVLKRCKCIGRVR